MSLPIIPSSNPTVVPANEAQTYDHYWMKNLSVQAQNPNKPIRILASLNKAATLLDGTTQLSPVDKDVTIIIPDVFAAAAAMSEAGDDSLNIAMAAVLQGLINYAKFQNITL